MPMPGGGPMPIPDGGPMPMPGGGPIPMPDGGPMPMPGGPNPPGPPCGGMGKPGPPRLSAPDQGPGGPAFGATISPLARSEPENDDASVSPCGPPVIVNGSRDRDHDISAFVMPG